MKLLTRTLLFYIITTLIVFVGGSFVFYNILQNQFNEETDEKLELQENRILDFADKNDTVPALSYEANPVDYILPYEGRIDSGYKDTTFYSKEEEEDLPYRMLTFGMHVKQNGYVVRISRPLFESDDLIDAISSSFVILTGVLLVVIIIASWIVSRRLLKPFFATLRQLKEFRLDTISPIGTVTTKTKEFRQLNEALQEMADKARKDFIQMKTFTENASHELQTPLSVILAESEEMMQSPALNEEQMNTIRSINQTARRLSKLNQSLLLLAKISNRQFSGHEAIDMSSIVRKKMESVNDLLQFRELSCTVQIADSVNWYLHPVLADVLVNNLVMNAIRHTPAKGELKVTLSANEFSVSNSGTPLDHPEHIFERFYKESHSSESTGLGLAIVKQICETSGMNAGYSYENGMHIFRVSK